MKNIFNSRLVSFAAAAALTVNSASAQEKPDPVATCIPQAVAIFSNTAVRAFETSDPSSPFSQGLGQFSVYQVGQTASETIIDENPQNHHVTIQYWTMENSLSMSGRKTSPLDSPLTWPVQVGAVYFDKDVEHGDLYSPVHDVAYVMTRGKGWDEQIRATIEQQPNGLGCGRLETLNNPGCDSWQEQAATITKRGHGQMFQNEKHAQGQALSLIMALRSCVADSLLATTSSSPAP